MPPKLKPKSQPHLRRTSLCPLRPRPPKSATCTTPHILTLHARSRGQSHGQEWNPYPPSNDKSNPIERPKPALHFPGQISSPLRTGPSPFSSSLRFRVQNPKPYPSRFLSLQLFYVLIYPLFESLGPLYRRVRRSKTRVAVTPHPIHGSYFTGIGNF